VSLASQQLTHGVNVRLASISDFADASCTWDKSRPRFKHSSRTTSGVRLDPHTGKLGPFSSDEGLHRPVVDARVVDEDGKQVGWLQEICERAIAAWEGELMAADVQISHCRDV